ncbi:MAG: GntR family transcriptional regulator [Planctomycetes bacterium]|jgi:DNA-binding GntR family transcriptional regulator|nr:GntR family transcriptional regulator [Planctomycetota bacterium]
MPPLTLRQRAYRRIRDKFLSGELVAGMTLSENQLAKDLGMSRTPVREAIRQMEMEGLLDYAPRFGAIVRTPDARELGEMYAVREALESFAAEAAAEAITPGALARLDELWGSMQQIRCEFEQTGEALLEGDLLQRFLEIDLEFHQVIVDAAGNEYLSKTIKDARLLVRVFVSTFWRYDREKLAEANGFHKRLLDALRAKDTEASRIVTVEAMRVAKKNALQAWDQRERILSESLNV